MLALSPVGDDKPTRWRPTDERTTRSPTSSESSRASTSGSYTVQFSFRTLALDDSEHRIGWTLERAAAILPWSPHERADVAVRVRPCALPDGRAQACAFVARGAVRVAVAAGDESVEDRARLYLSYFSQWFGWEGPSSSSWPTARAGFRALRDSGATAKASQSPCATGTRLSRRCGRADEAAELASARRRTRRRARRFSRGGGRAGEPSGGSGPRFDGGGTRRSASREEMLEAGLRQDLWSPPPNPLRLLAALGSAVRTGRSYRGRPGRPPAEPSTQAPTTRAAVGFSRA